MKQGLQGKAQMPQGGMEPDDQMKGEPLTKEEMIDVEIGVGLIGKFLKEPQAQQLIQEAMQGQGDPAAKLGVFFSQLIDKIQNKMQDTPTPLSAKIWLSQGGVIDQVVKRIGGDDQLAVAVKDEIMNLLKLQNQAMSNQEPPMEDEMPMEDQGAPMQQAPPMPMMGGM